MNIDMDAQNGAEKIVTGIDLCRIERIRKVVEKHGDRFLEKIFTQAEREYCQSKSNWARCFAARFAAKEAVAKMLGSGIPKAGFLNVEILNTESGKPILALHNRAKAISDSLCIYSTDISITHEKEYAVAIAVGLVKGV